MPDDLLAHCPPGAKIVDTGPLTLEQIVTELADADAAGHDVARLHSGDPSLYSALAEQCRRLDALGIGYEIVPGVPAFAAAAAALSRELTVPGVAQTVTLTRVATLSTPMPPGEDLATLARSGATLVLHLAAAQIDAIVPQLLAGGYRPETPAAVVAFASWPQQTVLRGTLSSIAGQMHDADITKTAVIVVGDVLAAEGFTDSYLYSVARRSKGGPLMRVLLLGGTAEGRELARRLHPHVDIISSLAGRVPDPALPVGPVRIGGFGGVDGLRRWLRDERIDAVIDATHPFAATMTAHAAEVCRELAMPHLVLARPPWDPGDAVVVASDADAAETVAEQRYSRVFLTTGRSGVKAFADSDAWFLIRAVTEPDAASLPLHHRLVLSRGPYRYDDEFALLREHRIDALVTKNSGGDMTRAKLDAAAALDIPVVMVARPQLPDGVTAVGTVQEAADWVAEVR